jgi:hypothetical protein
VGFLVGVADHRKVSLEQGIFQDFKNEARYYFLFLPALDALKPLTREMFKQVHDRH